MANRPRSSSGRLLLPMLFFAVLGALLGGGWLALLTFWIVLSHAAIALGGGVLGMALQWWFGRRRAEAYWVILIIVLLAPAVLGLLSDPLYAGVGAIAGAVVGLILGIVNRVRLARE